MKVTLEEHQLAIKNTKLAIERAKASGNIHEEQFLVEKVLPKLEKRLDDSQNSIG